MMRIRNRIVLAVAISIVATGWSRPLRAQTQATNPAAVDTLTKDVAIAVFTNLSGTKAAQIVDQLSACADSCDAVAIINRVGSWGLVATKMAELGRLKNQAEFQAMSPGDANAAIRRVLDQFYEKYKADKNYKIPLRESARMQMLATIDRMLPPNAVPELPVANSLTDNQQDRPAGGLTANPDSSGTRTDPLEEEGNQKQETPIGMIVLYILLGLLAGAGIVYFGLYRTLKNEVDRLTAENTRLSREVDTARRMKATNEPRQSQPQVWKQPGVAVSPQPEGRDLPAVDKQPAGLVAPPVICLGVPDVAVSGQNDPLTEPIAPPVQVQTPVPVSTPARSEVFYFPPPDPNGQFDTGHRAEGLSPESAYRFSTNASTPDVAAFRFEAEPGRLARLLTYRNYMIEPACDSENSYTSQFTRIVNRRDGQAVLENGAWRVKTKALIRYE